MPTILLITTCLPSGHHDTKFGFSLCQTRGLLVFGVNCIVTAGPTYEKLDEVRRLTNFSTGKLGIELANFLSRKGHDVTLLIGQQSTYCGKRNAKAVEVFTTTQNLRERLKKLRGKKIDAIFHAAAVSDFTFGKTFIRSASGKLTEIKAGKFSTRSGNLFVELVPTPKIISELRKSFPKAKIVGWKYEIDGKRDGVIEKALQQISENKTDACVANGKAYGLGFGLVTGDGRVVHFRDVKRLFAELEHSLRINKT
jgi:phosphopantothenate---cysteine ligase (CTP)